MVLHEFNGNDTSIIWMARDLWGIRADGWDSADFRFWAALHARLRKWLSASRVAQKTSRKEMPLAFLDWPGFGGSSF